MSVDLGVEGVIEAGQVPRIRQVGAHQKQAKESPGRGNRIQTTGKYGDGVPIAAGLTLGEVGCLKLLAPSLDLGVVEDLAEHPTEQPLQAGILKIAQ